MYVKNIRLFFFFFWRCLQKRTSLDLNGCFFLKDFFFIRQSFFQGTLKKRCLFWRRCLFRSDVLLKKKVSVQKKKCIKKDVFPKERSLKESLFTRTSWKKCLLKMKSFERKYCLPKICYFKICVFFQRKTCFWKMISFWKGSL